MELEEETKDVEEILDEMLEGKQDSKEAQKLKEYQSHLEEKYQQQLQVERERMQQYFSDQFRLLATANMDPYMNPESIGEVEGADKQNAPIDVEEEKNKAAMVAPPGLVRNAVAPFGVQRKSRSGNAASPYNGQEKERQKELERTQKEKEVERVKMGQIMKTPDNG